MTDITSRVGVEFTATGDAQVVRSLDEITKMGTKAEVALHQTADAQKRVAQEAKAAAAQTKVLQTAGLNLGRQFSDVGVSLASGINPMMVLIQQGPQIADAFQMAKTQGLGFREVVRGLGASIAPVAPLLIGVSAALAVVAGGFALFERAVDKQTKNATTFGETWHATLNVVGKAIMDGPIGDGLKWLGETFNKVMDTIVRGTMGWLDQLVGFWGAAYLTITKNWRNLPQAIGAIMVGAVNNTIATVEGLVNAVIQGINRVSSLAGLKAISEVDLPRLRQASNAVAAQFEKDQARIAASFRASREGLFDKIVAETDRLHDAHKKATKAANEQAKALQNLKAVADAATIDRSTIGQSYVLPMERFVADGLVATTESIGQAFAAAKREVQGLSEYMRDRFIYSGKLSFKEIGRYAKETFRQAIYDSFLAKPIKVVLDAVVQGLPTSGLGLALGLGQFAADAVGGKAGRAVSGGIGLAATGLGVGAFAGTTAGAAALGTLGLGAGAIGSIAALAGPIGLAAGALYAAVKLFNIGGKPSNNGAGFDLITGQLSGNKRNAETEQAAQGAGQAIIAIQDSLKAAGIGLGDTVRGLVIGTRDQTQIYLSSGRELRTAVGDSQAAVDASLRAILEGATYVSDAQKKLVESALEAGKGFDAISEILSKYEAAQKITGSLADQIQQLKDPKAFELGQVDKNIQAQRDSAKQLAADGYITADMLATINGQLDELRGLQIDQVLKRFGDSLNDAANQNLATANDNLSTAQQTLIEAYGREADALKETADRFRNLAASLRQYGQTLTGGGGGLGSSYATARALFLRTSALAQSGDAGALGDLQRVSDAYLQAAKAVAPDARSYARDLAAVRNAVESSALVADRQVSSAEQQLQALHDQVAALVKIDESVLSVAEAIRNLQGAIVTQAQAQAAVDSGKTTTTTADVAPPAAAAAGGSTDSTDRLAAATEQQNALLAEQNRLLDQIAKSGGTTANILTRVTLDGVSLQTTVAA